MGSGRSRLTRATGLARSRALAAECALRCLHSLTELGSHLTVVPEFVAEPGVPANAALVVATTLEVQLVGGFKQRVQLDRRGRGGRPLSAALALRVALVFATALSLGFAFVPPLARGSGFAFARSRAIAFNHSSLCPSGGPTCWLALPWLLEPCLLGVWVLGSRLCAEGSLGRGCL